MFAWVARQDRIWNGESIEISKCLRFVGSATSGFDNLMTICMSRLVGEIKVTICETNLDPVVDLNAMIGGIKIESRKLVSFPHVVTAR